MISLGIRFAARRKGIVTAFALGLLAVLFVAAIAVHLMTRQSYRELARLDAFLRATAVAEACHDRVLARLETRPWSERWFKGSFSTGDGTWNDGRYEYLLADGQRPAEADLLIRAHWEATRIVVFCRLQADPESLSPYRRVRTVYYGRESPETPLAPPGLQTLRERVDDQLALRAYNRGWDEAREIQILRAPSPGAIADILGSPPGPPIPPGPPPVDEEPAGIPAAPPGPPDPGPADATPAPAPPNPVGIVAGPTGLTDGPSPIRPPPAPAAPPASPPALASEILKLYRLVDYIDETQRLLDVVSGAAAACPALAAPDQADIADQTATATQADRTARQVVLDLARELTAQLEGPEPTFEEKTARIRKIRAAGEQWADANQAARVLRARIARRMEVAGCPPLPPGSNP